ncbi:MAG TPA: helix-turn-helix domain-containing protein [Pyrinomonadaceae bacterium]|jgi:DNA-binding NtrC family response regulator|nr:helix-turn-helix domain-containing protein [Pyrinomonadaceae bacterium]
MQNLERTFSDDISGGRAAIEAAKREILKTVAYTLLRQVYGVTEPQEVDVSPGVDFYDEVRRFEISLIQQALFYTSGKQTAAAVLLNLNVTTLHSKIKFYGIEMSAIKMSATHKTHELLPEILFQQKPKLFVGQTSTYISGANERESARKKNDERDIAANLQTLKAEVLKSMALALESKAESPTGFLDFDVKLGLNFYEEVTKFEVKLLTQALALSHGNQRAAARLLCLKTTTLNTKVKMYHLDLNSNGE